MRRRGVLVALAFVGACHRLPSESHDAGAAVTLAPATPKVDVEVVVKNGCLSCHTDQMLEQQRLTPKQWAGEVKKMIGWGALVEPEVTDALVAYLAARFGPDAGPYDPSRIASAAAAAAIAPEADGPLGGGDAKRGALLFRLRCSPCHAENGRGQIGVNLVDRPLLYRATEFAAIVRAGKGRMPPAPDLSDGAVGDLLADLRRR